MSLMPVSINSTNFGHKHKKSSYSAKDRAIVALTTALGVTASMAVLAKGAHYSLKPARMIKDIKNSYFAKAKFHAKEIIGIGVGTCLGGLTGGYIIDKDKNNRRAKKREAVMQMGNISIPILTVDLFNHFGKKYGKYAQAGSAIAGIFAGVFLANILMNKLGNILFKNRNNERGIKLTDFSAHLDDAVAAASYISDHNFVHSIARLVPFALMIAGNEVGNRKAD